MSASFASVELSLKLRQQPTEATGALTFCMPISPADALTFYMPISKRTCLYDLAS